MYVTFRLQPVTTTAWNSTHFLAVRSYAIVISCESFLAEAANDIKLKQFYSAIACRVAIGTYPTSKPGGGVTIKAGSISASFPILGGSR